MSYCKDFYTKDLNFCDCTKWYNKPLPKLPLPSLEHTFQRYLEYAQVLCQFEPNLLTNTKNAIENFKLNETQLVEQLEQLSVTTDNWATQFWLPAFYLKDRSPLPVNVSPCYVLPYRKHRNFNHFLCFAACIVCGFLKCRDQINRKEIARDYSRKGDRLCMEQYDKVFSSYREPKIDQDILHYKVNANDTAIAEEHIVVMCKNQAFVVYTHFNGQRLSPTKILQQLQEIVQLCPADCNTTEQLIGGGSCGYRSDAALFWQIMRKDAANEENFELVKNAIFVLCLDISNKIIDDHCKPPSIVDQGRQMLYGDGSNKFGLNRWYDSTLQIIVSNNGTNGICIEHSVAEGIAIFNIVDSVLTYVEHNLQLFSSGTESCSNTGDNVRPRILRWNFNNKSKELLQKQIQSFNEITNDIDLWVLRFDDFGKEYIKSLNVSPDGFVQLAIQLAAYKWFNKLVPTYESGSLRAFSGGRVDNIRATTPEAYRWVKAMNDSTVEQKEKKRLFYEAAKKQALVTQENITGFGIDNHLIALFELANLSVEEAKRDRLPELFNDPTWTKLMQFPVSTSQATQSTLFSDRYNFYGPMIRNGYGIPYNIQRQFIILTVSAYRSSEITDGNKFCELIRSSMLEIRDLILSS